ncbi:MAG: glycosyltransferase family 4 protein [bacterium]
MRYKIAYLTSKKPLDKKQTSGVYYYQSKSIEKYCGEITYLGPVNHFLIYLVIKISNLFNRLSPKKYKDSHSIIISKIYGWIFTKKLKNKNFDIIFSDKSSCEIAYVKTNIPIIYSTDATFKLLHNYYPKYTNLLKSSVREGNYLEKKAIHNASSIICTSEWAAFSVINDYHYPKEKVNIMVRGANIDKKIDMKSIYTLKNNNKINLLFLGEEWYRKGYDIAYNAMKHIKSKKQKVGLTVVGFNPPAQFIDENVKVLKYVNKNTKEGIDLFDNIMYESNFLLLPTRAECVAIAFNEAAAYGLPVITRNTGGITEVIKDGINGYALPENSTHQDFADKILEIYNSKEHYKDLIKSSRAYYEKRLNWDHWGRSLKKLLDQNINYKS